MTLRKQIKMMVNISKDGKFEILAGNAGLYCIAFFGHKGTRAQKAKLRYIWKMIYLYN